MEGGGGVGVCGAVYEYRAAAEHGCHFININKEQLVIVENWFWHLYGRRWRVRGRHLKSSNSTGVEKLDG